MKPCVPCGKRARRSLEFADKYGIPLPGPVRRHFERTAAKADSESNSGRRVSVRQGDGA